MPSLDPGTFGEAVEAAQVMAEGSQEALMALDLRQALANLQLASLYVGMARVFAGTLPSERKRRTLFGLSMETTRLTEAIAETWTE